MGNVYDLIDDKLRSFIDAQRVFFVATAPSSGGHVNLSPKGLETLKVIDERTIAYLDFVGSGAETIAHLRDNGRIVIMMCAFEGPPKIVRLHGRGEAIEPEDADYTTLNARFAAGMAGRSIIRVRVERVSDSCGYGVPLYRFQGERDQLGAWAERKGEEGLLDYQRKNNRKSIDGLPALRWTEDME
jgi:predicted pyridoxine 5'-phosphate oxidase superfamily flavin-nucleotide-binding protein